MEAIDAKHYIAGGVYAKEWRAEKVGAAIEQHEHTFDHLSYLAVGSVRVEVEGQPPLFFHAPTGICIKAHKKHKITALTPEVLWLCVHAIPEDLRDAQVIDALLQAL